jgi:hypothetical protein
VVVLLRNRWNVGLMVTQAVLEVLGMICLYFVVFVPVFNHINPDLVSIAEIAVIIPAVLALISRGSKVVGLLNYGRPLRAKRNG